jgi:UrcA family protein
MHADCPEISVMLQSNRFYALSAACFLLTPALSGCVSGSARDWPDSGEFLQKRVSYAGLDLNTDAGARVLFRRLKSASEQVCEPLEGQRLDQHQLWRKCVDRALADAVRQVNRPQVTVLYQESAYSSKS